MGLKDGTWYGTEKSTGMAFDVVDAKPEETWATYPNGQTALAVRPDPFGGGDIFLGIPELAAEMVHAFAMVAGSHRYLRRDDIGKASIWAASGHDSADSGVLTIQAMEDATIHLMVPSFGNVSDVLTSKCIGTGPSLPISMEKGEVRVLTW